MIEDQQTSHLEANRVLVTGASSGIGQATCRLLSSLGTRIVGIDTNSEGLARTSLEWTGPNHTTRCLDLREVDHIPNWLKEISAEGGHLTGVVHAAGVPCVHPIRLLESSRYREVLLVNTEAALALARGFQSKTVCSPSGGSIVFISSVMASVGSPGAAAYGMTKAALVGLTKSLALELAPKKIRVNCVAPGFVRTPMFDRVSIGWDADQFASVEAKHPLGLGTPEDVANAIIFLLAETSRWITGTTLTVDGGYTAQ